ncbi:MAG TPA: cob(I)yrinic acid a,c-diamide adenosyltransferase [Candidatus Brocadiia bacterium]|nr:cob(I)yrinic acid a,c-diamide adenosyltransferase [Candidatus Brocadiia bacterium]
MTGTGRGWERGCVQVYTGGGKGKTTAALGLALRAAGAGLRVFFCQFLKGRPTSEIAAMERFKDLVTVRRFGACRFVRGQPSAEDLDAARQGLEAAREALTSGRHDVVILDETCSTVRWGLLTKGDLLSLVDAKPRAVELVFTGRDAPQELVDRADLVTEMREVKHYYRQGVAARVGIEE